MKLVEIIVMEGIAVILLLFAYLIGAKGKLTLIAGYNERTAFKVKDKDGLRRLIARLCIVVSIGSAVMPVLTWYSSGFENGLVYVIGGYGGFVVGVVLLVVLQAREYTS